MEIRVFQQPATLMFEAYYKLNTLTGCTLGSHTSNKHQVNPSNLSLLDFQRNKKLTTAKSIRSTSKMSNHSRKGNTLEQ